MMKIEDKRVVAFGKLKTGQWFCNCVDNPYMKVDGADRYNAVTSDGLLVYLPDSEEVIPFEASLIIT